MNVIQELNRVKKIVYYLQRKVIDGVGNLLSALSDVDIDTPLDGQVLTYDSVLDKWVNAEPTGGSGSGGGGGTPAGSDTQVQFNDGGAFGGDAGLVYNKTTDALTVNGLVHTPIVQAHTSAGLLIEAQGGADVALFGAGGGQNATFYDGVKLDSSTASRILSTDASKNITALDTTTYPSLTELSYVKGVTSAIQTQLDGKLATGLSWLLASGGTLTANNLLSGSFGIGFGASVAANNKFRIRGLGTTTGQTLLVENSSGTARLEVLDNGKITTSGWVLDNVAGETYLDSSPTAYIRSGGISNIIIRGTTGPFVDIMASGSYTSTTLTRFFSGATRNASSGTSTAFDILLSPTYNFTGTAAYDVYSYWYSPTLTSMTGSRIISFGFAAGFMRWASILSPAQITANQNDYNPSGWNGGATPSGATIMRMTTDASRDVTGLVGGLGGRIAILSNVGSTDLVLKDESASSAAANRFALPNDITLKEDENRLLYYDATTSRWRVIGNDKKVTSAYTPTNVTTDRSYDANATTLDELADVVGTLIADLQSINILS